MVTGVQTCALPISQRSYFDTQADYFETLQKTFEAQAELESAIGISLDQLSQSRTEPK